MGRARVGLLAVAAAAVGGGLLVAPEPSAWRLALAGTVALAAYLLRQRVRVGTAAVDYGWCEVALIVGLVLVPAGWVPLVVTIGVVVARGVLIWRRKASPRSLPEVVAVHALATVVAVLLCRAAFPDADPYQSLPSAQVMAGLLLAATTYFFTVAVATRALLAVRDRMLMWQLHRWLWRRELAISVRNTTVGLTAVALTGLDQRWLLALLPVMWLLNRAYGHQLRASERRRMWSALAPATRALNRPDPAEVAAAGARGAVDVFAVGRAEVVLADGSAWAADQGGEVSELVDVPEPVGHRGALSGASPGPPEALGAVVPLLAGSDQVGQLRVHFPPLARPGPDEDAALQVYGAALAAALHEAATHQQLHGLLAQATRDAQRDPLTGLLNRAALLTQGETAVQLARPAAPVALLVVDVDHFREINDTLGHAAGDEVLRVTARRLQESAVPGELVGRLGGDEFAVLVTEPSGYGAGAGAYATGNGARPSGNGAGAYGDSARAYGNGLRPSGNASGDHAAGPGNGAGSYGTGAGNGDGNGDAIGRGRDLAARLAAEADIGGVPMPIGVTVGVVTAPAGTTDLTELLRRADLARLQARTGHGEVVGWYDPDQDAGGTDRPALLAELRDALARDDELVLVLQPVVDLATGAPTELEALVRWQHPRRGLLLPAEFVRVVENSDLLTRFTEYVVDRALATAARLGHEGAAVPVAVNLSARSLLDPGLPLTVGQLLRRHRVPGRRLVLEITETVVASELPGVVEALARLRSLGVRLAVDDFGTGHASLAFLARVRLDEVKVDGAFVARMHCSPEAAAIVRTTIELGRELGLRVVAEGVETADQRQRLDELGCTAAQGYFFARPTPADPPALAALVNAYPG